ncbi:MAG: ABC transporter ATP-binding protein [Methylocystis sp.]|nr:ABC transporter ATP-binding protein [Methylocystis sp.]MCA3582932.1 ABC transporter ATP-binding protein [Methylocystis sp.]MCA3588363.1 ABC transporter ATP-binding protein [Methylocystis sp.]MCA3590337.1 ABC transporter ATP-binding protein [Methylocystis sp.]
MSAPLLSVRDLRTEFATKAGPIKAVDGVCFDLQAGEILGLVGESGSGKTVTGFSILGLIDPPGRIAGGSVRLEGRELVGLTNAALRDVRGKQIAMVFQDPSATLNPVLSIGAQMKLALDAHGRSSATVARERSVEVLTRVGIPDPAKRLDAYPHQFSGGMRQRVAIAIALLNRPKLIICDEPTTALDVSIQAQILTEMKALARDMGTAMIWISHDLATVSSIASRILVMYAGRIIEEGGVAEVLRAPRHPYTRGLLESLPANATPGQDLMQIPGSTPSLLNLPPGCPFAPRCSYADDLCRTEPPRLTSGSRAVRCHHPLAMEAA